MLHSQSFDIGLQSVNGNLNDNVHLSSFLIAFLKLIFSVVGVLSVPSVLPSKTNSFRLAENWWAHFCPESALSPHLKDCVVPHTSWLSE